MFNKNHILPTLKRMLLLVVAILIIASTKSYANEVAVVTDKATKESYQQEENSTLSLSMEQNPALEEVKFDFDSEQSIRHTKKHQPSMEKEENRSGFGFTDAIIVSIWACSIVFSAVYVKKIKKLG